MLLVFFPNAISLWNNFITSFQDFPTFIQLKNHLISLFRPKCCSIFGIHDPISLRYFFQLRVGLSKSRDHKKLHNFADTPSNICLCKTGVENTNHYLLQCPFYNSLRTNLKGLMFYQFYLVMNLIWIYHRIYSCMVMLFYRIKITARFFSQL